MGREWAPGGTFLHPQNHSSVGWRDKLWVIGGDQQGTTRNDVWSTSDGVSWVQEVDETPFGRRHSHASVLFQDRLWVVGGYGGVTEAGSVLGDLWYSDDGVNWQTPAVESAMPGRESAGAAVFLGRLWIAGGDGLTQPDVWVSVPQP